MELIRVESVDFSYARSQVLTKVPLSVERGQIVCLLGPNGSGKTTLLKIMLGLIRPAKGSVYLEGQEIRSIRAKSLARRLAYVPQTHRIGFAYKVIDIVLMGRTPHKHFLAKFSPGDNDIACSSLERLSILHLRDRNYNEISGGERQLTLIARALTQGARTLIMDEPANGLDYGNQIRLLEQIVGLARDGYTFVLSTHFPDHALWVASHVAMLHKGMVVAAGKPESVINNQTILGLYGAQVQILQLNEHFRICVPRSFAAPNWRGPPSDRSEFDTTRSFVSSRIGGRDIPLGPNSRR